MVADAHRRRGRGSSVGYVIVLLGAALFVTSCFLPYYGFPGGQSVSLYDQLLVAQNGGLELGAKLFLFGGVSTVVVVALIGLIRGERQIGARLPRRRGLSVVTHLDRFAASERRPARELDRQRALT
jgi:hypothetical protein